LNRLRLVKTTQPNAEHFRDIGQSDEVIQLGVGSDELKQLEIGNDFDKNKR